MGACRLLERAAALKLVKCVDNILFDCDAKPHKFKSGSCPPLENSPPEFNPHGVLWNGPDVIQGCVETVATLRNMGKKIYYVTNNSTKSRRDYVEKCQGLGFKVKEEEMVCTAYVIAQYLHNLHFKGKVYLVGEKGVADELDRLKINHTDIGPDPVQGALPDWVDTALDPEVDCVLVGFDRHISFTKIMKAATYARRPDCVFVATNEDSCLPWNDELVIPGTGTMVMAVKTAAERQPVVMGKPNRQMFTILQKTFGLDPAKTLMVGDRLNTDIALAHNCGLTSLLVLTGISTLNDVENAKNSSDPAHKCYIPDYYLDSLGELGTLINGDL